jgi:hypothetical protein
VVRFELSTFTESILRFNTACDGHACGRCPHGHGSMPQDGAKIGITAPAFVTHDCHLLGKLGPLPVVRNALPLGWYYLPQLSQDNAHRVKCILSSSALHWAMSSSAPCGCTSCTLGDVAVLTPHVLSPPTDSHLVLYKGHTPTWANHMWKRGVSYTIMQRDGNLVSCTADDRPVWASHTHGNPGAYLIVQNDGNLVIYLGTRAIWASNTCCGV